jgi:hypothetical protein
MIDSRPEPLPTAPTRRSRWRLADAAVPVLFMASGAAGLVYQVVWTRDLVLVFGNTTQAIVTTVAAFLGGLGSGALLGGWLGKRMRRPLAVYGALELGVGCFALLMPWIFELVATRKLLRAPWRSRLGGPGGGGSDINDVSGEAPIMDVM